MMGQSYISAATNTNAALLAAALEYNAQGFKIVPWWNEPSGKKGFPPGYAQYREAQTADDVRRLFSRYPAEGVALLCTDGIEAVDIDVKHDPKGTIYSDFRAALDAMGLQIPHIEQETKSKGAHWLYRCPEPGKNQKLARRGGQEESMLETRGVGGLLFIAPSPGYEFVMCELKDIPTITQDQRDALISVCRMLDEAQEAETAAPSGWKGGEGLTPWDEFNRKTNILELMQGYGWTVVNRSGDYVRLNRPGAKNARGVDGSVSLTNNLFHPFSTSTEFAAEKAYTAATVRAIMEHGGDFSANAKALRRLGFGDQGGRQPDAATNAGAGGGKGTKQNDQGGRGDKEGKGAEAPIVQIENYLKEQGVIFRYNTVKNAVETRRGESGAWVELTERAAGTLEAELMRKGFKSVRLCVNALFSDEDFSRPFDPMRHYLDGLQWDGIDHIGHLCSFVKVEDARRDWFNTMLKKHLVRLVACALGRLPFNKQIFVLQGAQNDGKSSFVRFLCPPALKDYFTEYVDFSSKDGLITLARNYIINLDELSSLSRHDINAVKAFVSTKSVKARLPFDRRDTVLERHSSFFGTTNDAEILTDVTGNVRWLIMPVQGFNHDNGGPNGYVQQVNIDQVYAQAAAIVEAGDFGELTSEELQRSEGYNSAHMKRPIEFDLILAHFEPTEDRAHFILPGKLRDKLQVLTTHKVPNAEAIGRALAALHRESGSPWKYKQVQMRADGVPVRGYLLRERDQGSLLQYEAGGGEGEKTDQLPF